VIKFTSTFNYTGTTPETPFVPLEGLGPDTLFLSGSGSDVNSTTNNTSTAGTDSSSTPLERVLAAIHNDSSVTQQVAFLSYKSQFLAGGWRFLTCK
jgi:hypothetical protein